MWLDIDDYDRIWMVVVGSDDCGWIWMMVVGYDDCGWIWMMVVGYGWWLDMDDGGWDTMTVVRTR